MHSDTGEQLFMPFHLITKVHLTQLLAVSTILSGTTFIGVRAFAKPATMSASTSTKPSSTSSAQSLFPIPLRKVTGEAAALGASVPCSSLIKPNGAVIFVVRRPGCILCREEAMDLSTQLAPRLKGLKKQPRLMAVVAETTSVDGFVEAFKGLDTFLDEGRMFQKFLGDRWLGVQGMLYPSVWRNGSRATKKYPTLEGDLKGEGRRLGGLLVVDGKGDVVYQYNEKVFGDHAPMDEVFEAASKL
ncbi:hypothetical protein VYU27_007580 [Nannochloropsis oceanica]